MGAGRWALGERACGRRWACVGARAQGAAAGRARGRLGERQQHAGRAAGWARGSSAQGARGVQATGGRRASRHGVGAQGRAGHGRPGRGLGAGWVRRLGQLGQFWCTMHLAQF